MLNALRLMGCGDGDVEEVDAGGNGVDGEVGDISHRGYCGSRWIVHVVKNIYETAPTRIAGE